MRKKKSRWRRVLLWSSFGLIILLVASLFVMNYAVDKVLRSMSGMDAILEEVEASNGKDNSSSMEGDKASPTSDVTNTPSPTPSVNDEHDGQSATSTETSKAVTSSDTIDLTYKAEISTAKANVIKEKATVTEKAKVASLLIGNLSKDDIMLLTDLASGGLDLEEKKEARALILEKLSEEQYNSLINVAKKYGLSEGKQYSEVILEE